MDALDIRILRTMAVRPYGVEPKNPDVLRASVLARALDVTVDTVRARLKRMENSGVLAGYEVFPNLRHLDRTASAFLFSVPADRDKDAALEAARGVPGFLEARDFLGRGICIDFAHRDLDDLRTVLASYVEATGDPRARRFYDRDMPQVKRALTPLDWRILQALRGRATRPLGDVAEDVGVSLRTVKRRYDQMSREGSAFVVPRLDPSRASGIILFELVFRLRGEATRQTLHDIREAFADHLLFGYVPSAGQPWNFSIFLHAQSPSEVDRLRQRGAALPGAEAVEPWLFRRYIEDSRWIDDAIGGHVNETGP